MMSFSNTKYFGKLTPFRKALSHLYIVDVYYDMFSKSAKVYKFMEIIISVFLIVFIFVGFERKKLKKIIWVWLWKKEMSYKIGYNLI